MENHNVNIEAILLAAGKPLTIKKIAALLSANESEIHTTMELLHHDYQSRESGIQLYETSEGWQMGTAPSAAPIIAAMIKDETTGEMTKAQIETLTIIAYRGPITKGTLEEIRGVNCSMILRNLLIRGLIIETNNADRSGEKTYTVSHELIGFLGITRVQDLPNYGSLSSHEALEAFLKSKEPVPTRPDESSS